MNDILDRIVATKRRELEALEALRADIVESAHMTNPALDFRTALAAGDEVAVIAECKRRSPGAGDIRPDLSPTELASMYEGSGARAMSVLTDEDYFGGGLWDLREVRGACGLPLLRKDFTIDPLHVYQARQAGADAVLLIVRILTDEQLIEFRELAQKLGMAALVEAHDAEEVDRAMSTGADILGINNRDLRTFETTLDVTLRMLDRLPRDVVVVSESGIRTAVDVERLGAAGVDAVLVGESLLRQDDPGAGVAALAGHPKAER